MLESVMIAETAGFVSQQNNYACPANCFREGRAIFKKLGLQHMVEMIDNMARSVDL